MKSCTNKQPNNPSPRGDRSDDPHAHANNHDERERVHFGIALRILTAVVFVGTVVTVQHAIAVFVAVDALSVSAYEFRRGASCAQKERVSIIKNSATEL